MTLNKLQDYIIPDLDLCKRILDKRSEFATDTLWKKWSVTHIQESVTGKCPKKKASLHFDWLYFYLKDRTELINKIINERDKNGRSF